MTIRTINTLKTNMPVGVTGGTTVQDLHDIIDTFSSRTFVSVKEFGAVGDGSNDDTAAIQAALNSGEPVYLPAGTYRITATLNITINGTKMHGAGRTSLQTRIAPANATMNAIRVAAQFAEVAHLEIWPLQIQTAGYAVVFEFPAFYAALDNVFIHHCFNAVLMNNGTETRINRVALRALYGWAGIHMTGTVGSGTYRAILCDLSCDNPYPLPLAADRGAWTPNTSYAVGQTVHVGGAVYQCSQSGTSGSSGPSGFASGFDTNMVDGSARWLFTCNDLTWVLLDSYGYSLIGTQLALISGAYGIRMIDSANTGTSYPVWILGYDIEIDHPYFTGVSLERGEGFQVTTFWFGSSLSDNGIRIGPQFRGEVSILNGRIMGNKNNGVLIENGPLDTLVTGCQIGDNGGNGVVAAAGASRFIITGNRIGDLIGVGGNAQPYGVFIAAGNGGNYIVNGNNTQGNQIAGIADGGTGPFKNITDNL